MTSPALAFSTSLPTLSGFNLDELPQVQPIALAAAEGDYAKAAAWIKEAELVLVKVGGGGRDSGPELTALLERAGAALVHTPIATGCVPYDHPQNMTVGGSKGSLPRNFAMENADL